MNQPDLFPHLDNISADVLREEARFGKWDAKCGLPLHNYYSSRISGPRLAAYRKAYTDEQASLRDCEAVRGDEGRGEATSLSTPR